MRKPATPAAAFATAALLLLATTAAYASHSQITVGGIATPATVPATMDNVSDITFESNYGVPITCESADADIEIHRGTSVDVDDVIGHLQQMSLTDCTMTALNFAVEWAFRTSAITVRTHPTNAGDPIAVDIEVDATVTATGCDIDVEGSMRALLHPGDTNADGYIELQTALDMEVVRGYCMAGEIIEGDLMQATGGTFELTTSGPNAGLISHG